MSFIAKFVKNLFGGGDIPKPKPPPPPPATPSRADASMMGNQQQSSLGLRSLINTTSTGLSRKANTAKRSLLGGGSTGTS